MNRMPSAYSADSVSLTSRMCSRARGARHAPLAQQLAQRHEQVQVEIGQVGDRAWHGATI